MNAAQKTVKANDNKCDAGECCKDEARRSDHHAARQSSHAGSAENAQDWSGATRGAGDDADPEQAEPFLAYRRLRHAGVANSECTRSITSSGDGDLEFGLRRRSWGPARLQQAREHVHRAEVVWPGPTLLSTYVDLRIACERTRPRAGSAGSRCVSLDRGDRDSPLGAARLARRHLPRRTEPRVRDRSRQLNRARFCHAMSSRVAECCRGSRTFRGPLRLERGCPQVRHARSPSLSR